MEFTLRVDVCPLCNSPMMKKAERGIFPHHCTENQDSQMRHKGVLYVSESMAGNEYICEDCSKKGLAYFICALCGGSKPSSKQKETISS